MAAPPIPAALGAYEALAGAYDTLTADYGHDRWLAALLEVASAHGLEGDRALDCACGTGASFLPLLQAGFAVTAFDLSPAMAAQAAAKAPVATVLVRDLRTVERLGAFDLVTCLDDALNYLTTPRDLEAALSRIAANLAPDGVALWDVNTLASYRTQFASSFVVERGDHVVVWRGAGSRRPRRAGLVEATVDVFAGTGDGATFRRSSGVHRQRHHPAAEVRRLARRAGLEVVQVLGQRVGARLEPRLDERRHTKAVFVARHQKGGGRMIGRP